MPASRPLPSTLVAVAIVLLVAGCGTAADSIPTGSLASPIPTATAPSPATSSDEPTGGASGVPTPAASASEGADAPNEGTQSPDAFWATVRRGLADAGHLIVSADGSAPVVIRYLPEASEALVGGDLVSRCVGTRSWAGDSGALAPVPGSWRCGAEALVAGFRATAAPIDSWSPDFPAEGSPEESVAIGADGRWIWTYAVADGLEGPLEATLTLDPATGRVLEGSRTDQSGTTTWTFDYGTAVGEIAAP